jgi:hypothetical protein
MVRWAFCGFLAGLAVCQAILAGVRALHILSGFLVEAGGGRRLGRRRATTQPTDPAPTIPSS